MVSSQLKKNEQNYNLENFLEKMFVLIEPILEYSNCANNNIYEKSR